MNDKSDWIVEVLNTNHDRTKFDCGTPELNSYLIKFARQNAIKNISKTFVTVSPSMAHQILGFYTLNAGSIAFENLPEKVNKKLPKYPVPVARLARLAVDKTRQGKGLGEYLLMDCLKRCVLLSQDMGLFGVVVDAKDNKASDFYQRYGFYKLTDQPLTLFLSISSVVSSLPLS